jgi:predicted ester cyclase
MSAPNNEAIYRRLIEEAFNGGNLEVADELVAPGALEHQRGGPGDGPEGVKRTVTYLRTAFPDFTLTIDEVVAVGDKVWARQRGGGTNLGTFAGRPPTGKKAFIDVIDIARFQDGKLVEHWGVPDQLGMMQALGLIQ